MVEKLNPMPEISKGETAKKTKQARLRLHVNGIVQGVGFRPFVHHIATGLGLSGFVCNDNGGVLIEVEGDADDLAAFQQQLSSVPPPMSRITEITAQPLMPTGEKGFTIIESQCIAEAQTLVSPDLAVCDDCVAELFNPNDRRYRYPFINCTNCGPRFTIIRDLPYDRPMTTMAEFEQCPRCHREYEDPGDRRFHAQPNACAACGPHLEFRWLKKCLAPALARRFAPLRDPLIGEDALLQAQRLIAYGGIVAVKGIGGFHLACDATNDLALMELRRRKGRAEKPFAIMARDLASAFLVAHISAEEIKLLTSPERPIVLLKKRAGSRLSTLVAPGNPNIGVMLPYSPLHHLLFAPDPAAAKVEPVHWLVMTSANASEEPIIFDNNVAADQLGGLADALLLHNRSIHVPCDDSVVRVVDDQPLPIRRSRGYAPIPIMLPTNVPPILAVGADLKNTFCLAQGRHAFMSQHIGDMQSFETQQSFTRLVAHMQQLFHIEPEVVACDLHPAYLSTGWATEWVKKRPGAAQLLYVQHHHAHIAALMAEHGLTGERPVIGFCFDGTGYGTDGAIWGGEVLVADYRHFDRVGHLSYFPLPGGDAAIHKPYRMALAALWAAGIEWDNSLPPVQAASETELAVLRRQLEAGLNCVPTSSMGRLFDAVASIAGVRHIVTYEAQAAIELEAHVTSIDGSYHFAMPASDANYIDARPVLAAVVSDTLNQVPAAVIANRFHAAVANLVLEMSLNLRGKTGLNQVALSGGVFQNAVLLQRVLQRLRAAHFDVLVHRAVPPNDGGLSLGQAMIAAHQVGIQGGKR